MTFKAQATTRTDTGKSAMRKMRRAGQVPAVMYGHGDPSVMLAINEHDFGRLIERLRGHSPLIEVEVDGRAERCVIKTLQRNPINGRLLHVDFQKVHAEEKVTVNVPVLLRGTSIGVKEGGLLDHLLREIPVRATIDRVPEHFEVDITSMKMGQSFHLSRLEAEGIEFTLPPDSVVVTVLVPRKVSAETATPAAAETTEGAEATDEKAPADAKNKEA